MKAIRVPRQQTEREGFTVSLEIRFNFDRNLDGDWFDLVGRAGRCLDCGQKLDADLPRLSFEQIAGLHAMLCEKGPYAP